MPNETVQDMIDEQAVIMEYHYRSKHHLQRYAAGPATLDWDQQPNPFRHFLNAPVTRFQLHADTLSTTYQQLYDDEAVEAAPLTFTNLGAFFELSFALSAWKQYGTARWSLRCNPSSGNLHPTEAYAVLPEDLRPVRAGVYHYSSDIHALEQRCALLTNTKTKMPANGFLLGLTNITWREAWKYGERAFRYCQLDTGHAIACADYAAATLGWRTQLLHNTTDAHINTLLGLTRKDDFTDAEHETPELLLWVTPAAESHDIAIEPDVLTQLARQSTWTGQANLLDPKPMYSWPVIDEVTQACEQIRADSITTPVDHIITKPPLPLDDINMSRLLRQRRSAQAYDGQTGMHITDFVRLLAACVPDTRAPVWRSWPYAARIQPVFFVHRIEGLAPGLYVQLRDPEQQNPLRMQFNEQFDWQTPGEGELQTQFAELGFYHLVSANAQSAARKYACHQDIASDSAFAVAMLAPFRNAIAEAPWYYRQLYWECGMLGQVMYIEAEASALRGTGIGCFFDDAIHDVLGIRDDRWQCLYQFTVGGALVDRRLITLPPYTT